MQYSRSSLDEAAAGDGSWGISAIAAPGTKMSPVLNRFEGALDGFFRRRHRPFRHGVSPAIRLSGRLSAPRTPHVA